MRRSSTFRCVVIDDEPIATDILKNFIETTPELMLSAVFHNPMVALNELKHLDYDILFLDINMPHLNGIELSKMISSEKALIFTTAYSEYAIESYDVEATDYLLKPIAYPRFLNAIQKVSRNSEALNSTVINLKSGQEFIRVNIDEIMYAKSEGNYIDIVTTEQKFLILMTMNSLIERLDPRQFCKVHRSYIVNKKHILSYSTSSIKLKERDIPIGEKHLREFLKFIE